MLPQAPFKNNCMAGRPACHAQNPVLKPAGGGIMLVGKKWRGQGGGNFFARSLKLWGEI